MSTAEASTRPNGGRLGLMSRQAMTELVAARRNVEFVVAWVAIPAILYAMFALSDDDTFVSGGATFSTLAVGSYTAYGVVTLAIFTFGDEVAKERGRGWIRTLRATPIPVGVYMVGKLAMAAIYAALIIVVLALVSVPTGAASLGLGTWLMLGGLAMAGVIAFSTLGLALAFLVRPRAATAIATLVFLPLAFCSGFFFPLSELPAFLRDVAPYLPTYHFGQLVWQVVGSDEDAAALTGVSAEPLGVHALWVFGCTVVFGVVALIAARREAVGRR